MEGDLKLIYKKIKTLGVGGSGVAVLVKDQFEQKAVIKKIDLAKY